MYTDGYRNGQDLKDIESSGLDPNPPASRNGDPEDTDILTGSCVGCRVIKASKVSGRRPRAPLLGPALV